MNLQQALEKWKATSKTGRDEVASVISNDLDQCNHEPDWYAEAAVAAIELLEAIDKEASHVLYSLRLAELMKPPEDRPDDCPDCGARKGHPHHPYCERTTDE